MTYGEGLRQLNPLSPQVVGETLARFCPAQGQVADIGCGRGTTLAWLREHTGCQTCGVETDPELAASCGAIPGRAEALPLADASQDAVVLECVFSLLEQASVAAGELRRVLRPGGVALISDLYGRQGSTVLTGSSLLHHIYTAEELTAIFAAAGFECCEFTDHTFEMQTMLAQMIMDGVACDCTEPANRALLKQVKAGYGLWVFRTRKGGSYAGI